MDRPFRHHRPIWLAALASVFPWIFFAAPMRAEDAAFLADLHRRTFDWFWETTNPENGLVPDRYPSRPFCSIAAVGFGLTAYGVGAEHGYVSRSDAARRTLDTLRFFANAPQGDRPSGMSGHKGFYYHFLEMDTGTRFRTNELSSIDTALLMMGVLFSKEYFDGDDPVEVEIRKLAEELYRRVRWDWFQVHSSLMTMAWTPEQGFGRAEYQGFNEAMFLYILALGSPTHPIRQDAWEAYTRSYRWGEFHGQSYVQFSPLFGYQYTHVWVDPRGLQDAYLREKGIDCHENGRRATYAHRAYCQANPMGFRDYSDTIWGLTACDGPAETRQEVNGNEVQFHRYWARGASLQYIGDDGTIAPTAAGGSIPFAPEITIPALKAIRDRYGERVYNRYGFVDAFNPTFRFPGIEVEHGHVDPEWGWFDAEQLGIDQGPILLMLENHQTGLVWETMKRNPHVRKGLERAGFTAPWLSTQKPGN